MPYIDKQYAEELLKKSQTGINDELLHTVGDTDQGVTKPQTRFRDMSSLGVDDAGQEACTARKSHGACFGSLDQSGLQPKSRARLRLQNASLSLEPIMAERTEDETKAFEKVTRLACARERGSRELGDRLVRDGFSREVAKSAVQRALDCGLIDDVRYGSRACSYARCPRAVDARVLKTNSIGLELLQATFRGGQKSSFPSTISIRSALTPMLKMASLVVRLAASRATNKKSSALSRFCAESRRDLKIFRPPHIANL